MDNFCHTLVGAALGEAGLKRRTALAMPALLIGANLPDVDVLAYFWGSSEALGFRRGWTHGLPALLVWPFLLTGLLLAWDRWVRRRRRPDAKPAEPLELLWLSTLALLTHPFLDWLNTYGLRWLMPFDGTWFYGDVLFIADPWIWLALSLGVFGSRRRRRLNGPSPSRPARWALAAVGLYVVLSWSLQLASRRVAERALSASGRPTHRMMAGPVPVNPFRREIVSDSGEGYDLAIVDWLASPKFRARERPYVPKNGRLPGVAEAATTREGAIFLDWARFPFFLVEGDAVQMIDARYSLERGEGFARQIVELPRRAPGGSTPKGPAQSAWPPSPGHRQVPIWPGAIPDARPVEGPEVSGVVVDSGGRERLVAGKPWIYVDRVSRPTMTVYPPEGRNTGAAVVVFPGGGYNVLAIDLEGTEACDWLTSKGVTCVLLKYRVPCVKSGPYRNCRTALQDAQRTVGLVRFHAAEWHIDPRKIGVLGFSAGGHMVAAMSTQFEKRLYPAVDAADKVSCRPDFAVALYPGHLAVPAKGFALNPDHQVSKGTPPTFLLHSTDDPVDPVENSLVYYAALRKAGVPAEMHLYVKGGHAFGLRRTESPITGWPKLVETWLETIGMTSR